MLKKIRIPKVLRALIIIECLILVGVVYMGTWMRSAPMNPEQIITGSLFTSYALVTGIAFIIYFMRSYLGKEVISLLQQALAILVTASVLMIAMNFSFPGLMVGRGLMISILISSYVAMYVTGEVRTLLFKSQGSRRD